MAMKGKPTGEVNAAKGKLRLQTLIEGAYTAEQWVQRFRRLQAVDQFRLWSTVVPKEHKVDNSSTFRLVIEGLQNKVIDTKVIENKALEVHGDDAD